MNTRFLCRLELAADTSALDAGMAHVPAKVLRFPRRSLRNPARRTLPQMRRAPLFIPGICMDAITTCPAAGIVAYCGTGLVTVPAWRPRKESLVTVPTRLLNGALPAMPTRNHPASVAEIDAALGCPGSNNASRKVEAAEELLALVAVHAGDLAPSGRTDRVTAALRQRLGIIGDLARNRPAAEYSAWVDRCLADVLTVRRDGGQK